jgi:hypothetical protein
VVAVMMVGTAVHTASHVERVKSALADPMGIVTEVGTLTCSYELLRLTVTPPAPATPSSSTLLLWLVKPAAMLVGISVSSISSTGPTVRVAVRVTPPALADSVIAVGEPTA